MTASATSAANGATSTSRPSTKGETEGSWSRGRIRAAADDHHDDEDILDRRDDGGGAATSGTGTAKETTTDSTTASTTTGTTTATATAAMTTAKRRKGKKGRKNRKKSSNGKSNKARGNSAAIQHEHERAIDGAGAISVGGAAPGGGGSITDYADGSSKVPSPPSPSWRDQAQKNRMAMMAESLNEMEFVATPTSASSNNKGKGTTEDGKNGDSEQKPSVNTSGGWFGEDDGFDIAAAGLGKLRVTSGSRASNAAAVVNAAKLAKPELFVDPPPRPVCPICRKTLPLESPDQIYQECCGAVLCKGCVRRSEREAEIRHKKKKEGVVHHCVVCGTRYALHDRERLQRIRKRMEQFQDDEAYLCMADYYEHGKCGLPKNRKKYFELVTKAAELGSLEAHFFISVDYDQGRVVKHDPKKERHHLEIAAAGGHVKARLNLGHVEAYEGNYDLAYEHYAMAASAGCDEAMDCVSEGYECGNLDNHHYHAIEEAYDRAVANMKSRDRDKYKSK